MNLPSDLPPEYWEIVDRYRAELVAQAKKILGNKEDAEDVVQETLCEAFRNGEKLANAKSLGSWLKSINRCNALNRLRSRRLDPKKPAAAEGIFTTGGFSALELQDTLNKAIQALSPSLREVVRLRFYEDLSYNEIAGRLKIPAGTVGSLLFDASLQLFELLKTNFESRQKAESKAEKPKDFGNDLRQ